MFKALKKRSVFGVFLFVVLVLALVLSTTSLGLAQEGVQPDDGAVTQGDTYHVNTDDKGAPAPAAPVLAFGAQTAQANQRTSEALDVSELEAVSIIVTFENSVDAKQLEALSGGKVVHSFSNVFNGASLVLAGDKVDTVANLRGVTGVYLDTVQQLDTDASPEFIGAPAMWDSLGGQDNAGEGVIVGILDSGIWPEHPSVSDPDPAGNAFPAPPTIPGSNGFGSGGPRSTCDFGDTAYNPADDPFTCNNKLIGAYDFTDTYKVVRGLLPTEFDSARDSNGHGSHTMTTSAGNGGVAATLLGVDRGIVSGIAPRAHVIAYKVCGATGCFQSDSVAAVEQAILDDVDVINFSISGGEDPYADAVEQAFAIAYDNGVFVAASAGNSGPGPDTVAHRGPWTMTVGASTSDRHFLSTLTLEADNGDTLELVGASVTAGISTATDVIYPPAGSELCLNPFAPGTFNGEIVLCQRGVIARVSKSFNVAEGGAGGMVLYNPVNQGLATDNHFIPSVHVDGDEGVILNDFMAAHTGVTGTFTDGLATAVPGDWMASFSSRGGPGQTLGISKPDITAPGVQILAANTPMPEDQTGGQPGELFQSIQGTSMSSPHIAGSAALVAALHPDWTPGQIKSALMTTANTNHMKEDGATPADPFDYGSGRVDLATAGNPGLTISDTTANFVALENELWHANYPSLYVPVMPGVITSERTVHSELNQTSVWRAYVDSPDDTIVVVSKYLVVQAGGDETFDIYVDAKDVPLGEVRHATVTYKRLGGAPMSLTFPISFVRQQPAITLEHSCDPLVFAKRDTTDCTITIQNTTFEEQFGKVYDVLPRQLRLVRRSVDGAYAFGNKAIYVEGTLAGAEPPTVDAAVDPLASAFGYFSLASLGVSPISGTSDESISNFNVPSFEFAGEIYSQIGIVSNGYIVVGGGTGADVNFINTDLPDAAPPNNVLAPFWTDLNPADGGAMYIGVLSAGPDSWIVVEWEAIQNWGDSEPNTFQVWIGLNAPDDISFVYANVSDGDSGFLTVGAENAFGNSGNSVYYNGVGTVPAPSATGYEVDVFTVAGEPGESHTISFTAKGVRRGEWQNCAEVTSDSFFGINTMCVNGEVTRP
ncbi:MAG: peptidase S8 [Chloroflexi bacterium]|nr:MAG: peptidase S8 [Chloroflexota bacterium]